ncbi:MAG TPA: exo-alpha-sialidase [Opitutaceae bacterium]
MISRLILFASLNTGLSLLAVEPPAITYTGNETVTSAADGGLRPAVGVHNIQVYRANRTAPAHADGLGHTYLHAPMLAWWHGRFYLDYLSGPVSEHEAPCPTSFTTSRDGLTWEAPRVLFPSFALSDGTLTLTHQRMSFFVTPDDRLLATAFHGKAPSPNDGSGIGRVVREIKDDGSLGPIHFIRYNRHHGWNESNTPYPFYTTSNDPGFVAACEALLANKLVTAQWWEEDRAEDGFYRLPGKAISIFHRADGKAVSIAKDAQHAISSDEGQSWTRLGFAANLPVNSSKYWGQRTPDGRYALVFNPTSRLRHPLAVATSDDGQRFDHLLAIHGELPEQRFPGHYKNMGPQYVRGISEGNGSPPGGALWLTYSVNKEDIWVSRVPVPITATAPGPVHDDFESTEAGQLPAAWNIYRPLWAPVAVVETAPPAGRALELRDEDRSDYAAVTRVFPAARSVKITFKLLARRTDGRLEIDVLGAQGERPVQIALTEDGRIEARHEGIWKPAGRYTADRWTQIEIDVNPEKNVDRFQFRVDGREVLRRIAYFTELVPTVERLVFRTGAYRRRGDGGHERADADVKAPLQSFLIDDVAIEPRP